MSYLFPKMRKWREMPGARAPLPIYPSRLGKGWANAAVCQCLLSSIEHRARPLPALGLRTPNAHPNHPATDRSRTRGYRSDNHTPVSHIHRHTHAPHVIHAAALRRNTHCAHLWGCSVLLLPARECRIYPLSTLIMALVDRYPPLTIVIHALPSPPDPSLSACLLLSSLSSCGAVLSTSGGRIDAGRCIRTML